MSGLHPKKKDHEERLGADNKVVVSEDEGGDSEDGD